MLFVAKIGSLQISAQMLRRNANRAVSRGSCSDLVPGFLVGWMVGYVLKCLMREDVDNDIAVVVVVLSYGADESFELWNEMINCGAGERPPWRKSFRVWGPGCRR